MTQANIAYYHGSADVSYRETVGLGADGATNQISKRELARGLALLYQYADRNPYICENDL